ncbi:hypothetical protein BO99DRAFT_429320 [Aspergillus violaceofuscus CBS 115571]|uniref:Uncharacterized protein n=1 Tax=Aspergillus violaceofuscus (strain CBS 115571) TaxID=1450538 RepID=A0A2V5HFT2_ASPV1|nr:hypothetical protein BO99DRAFT_429320 [Aspergillus violaceofuscus CBS 115571]
MLKCEGWTRHRSSRRFRESRGYHGYNGTKRELNLAKGERHAEEQASGSSSSSKLSLHRLLHAAAAALVLALVALRCFHEGAGTTTATDG